MIQSEPSVGGERRTVTRRYPRSRPLAATSSPSSIGHVTDPQSISVSYSGARKRSSTNGRLSSTTSREVSV